MIKWNSWILAVVEEGTMMNSVATSAASPPSLPKNATDLHGSDLHACSPLIIFWLLPDVDRNTTKSWGWHKALIWRENKSSKLKSFDMQVMAAVSELSEWERSPFRWTLNLPMSSAERCWVCDELPPFPHQYIVPPNLRVSEKIEANLVISDEIESNQLHKFRISSVAAFGFFESVIRIALAETVVAYASASLETSILGGINIGKWVALADEPRWYWWHNLPTPATKKVWVRRSLRLSESTSVRSGWWFTRVRLWVLPYSLPLPANAKGKRYSEMRQT